MHYGAVYGHANVVLYCVEERGMDVDALTVEVRGLCCMVALLC